MKKISLYIITVFYVVAGMAHFLVPQFYLNIMPPWMPLQKVAVFFSGILEIIFALLLIFPSTRKTGAWCLIGILIAIYPANIQMFLNYYHESNPALWIAIVRLPLQFILIWWAYTLVREK
ncbi:MAG: DoxX family protein [Saprospiraceae bacterium]